MSEHQSAEDPEPSQPVPAGTVFVPVRPGSWGPCVRLFRTPLGAPTAVAFTTEQQLAATLGCDQPWIRLAEPVLRALAGPLGVSALTVDPQLIAPPAVPRPVTADDARSSDISRSAGIPQAERRPAAIRS